MTEAPPPPGRAGSTPLINALTAGLLAAALGALTSWLFYPGLMSFDSIFQYRQVTGDAPVWNYHPPAMVYLWRLVHIPLGAGGLLLAHQLLHWAGIALIALSVSPRLWIRLLVILTLGLLPPLWIHSATVWNDSGVTAAFLFATGCALRLGQSGSRNWFYVALPVLAYGLLAKRSALFASIPLFIVLADAWFNAGRPDEPWGGGRWRGSVGVGAMLFASVVLAGVLLSSTGVERITKWPTIAAWDLAAVSLAEERLLLPRSVLNRPGENEAQVLAQLEQAFEPHLNGRMVHAVNLFPEPDAAGELFDAWLRLPLHHGRAYFTHRLRVFLGLMGTPWNLMNLPYQNQMQPNEYGLELRRHGSRSLETAFRYVRASLDTVLYKPWFYLLLLLAAVSYALARPGRFRPFERRLLIALGSSGLLYVLPLLLLAPATDFRYTLWMVAAAVVASCLALFLPRPR
jgi:hypothetical protein